ncbi:MAG TPA: hypothetical protein VHL98_07485, partial [Microvirga sp.]|nr:hypothetical protein [Microvirga sp.]
AGRLLRPLQTQHQLDQLFLAQSLKIAPAHQCRESAIRPRRKGVGNYPMISPTFLEHFALVAALAGLAAVIWEIAVKDASLFGAIVTDVRGMAEPTVPAAPRGFAPASVTLGAAANSNGLRKAA